MEEDKNDIDVLYEVRIAFHIGNYQNCINSASKLKNLTLENEFQKEIFILRSYLALKKYKIVLDDINRKKNSCFLPLEYYAKYLTSYNQDDFEVELDNFNNKNDFLYKIISSKYYIELKEYERAFDCLFDSEELECLSLLAQIYIQISRIDLAKNILLKMQAIDDDSVLTQLTNAWVNLATSTEKGAQEALYIFQEYCDKYTPSTILLNGLAAAHTLLKNYDEAETCCREALEKDTNNSEGLINLIAVLNLQNKHMEAERLLIQVLDEFPNHPFSLDYRSKEDEFERLNQMYKEGLKILPPQVG